MCGAHHHAVLGDLALTRGVAHTEIGDLHFAGVGNHDVGRLDVTMNHAVRVGHEQATRGLNQDGQQFDGIHRALAMEQVRQRFRGDVFHNQKADAVMLVVFEQRSDIRMRQIGGIMGFGTQAA